MGGSSPSIMIPAEIPAAIVVSLMIPAAFAISLKRDVIPHRSGTITTKKLTSEAGHARAMATLWHRHLGQPQYCQTGLVTKLCFFVKLVLAAMLVRFEHEILAK